MGLGFDLNLGPDELVRRLKEEIIRDKEYLI